MNGITNLLPPAVNIRVAVPGVVQPSLHRDMLPTKARTPLGRDPPVTLPQSTSKREISSARDTRTNSLAAYDLVALDSSCRVARIDH